MRENFLKKRETYFISISKFDSFNNPFTMVTSLFELRHKDRKRSFASGTETFIQLVQTKEIFSMNYSSNTNSLKP